MKIIKLSKAGVGKYKITLEDNIVLTLHEDVVVNNILLINKDIDNKLLEKINLENEKASIYTQSLKHIGTRQRSEKEIRIYLERKNFEKSEIDEVVTRLKKEQYIDDYKFASAFINDKLCLSSSGIYKIRRELEDHNIEACIIEDLLSKIDEKVMQDKMIKLIEKQIRLNNKYSGFVLKNRIVGYLTNLGYDRGHVSDYLDSLDLKDNQRLKKEYDKLYSKYAKTSDGYELEMKIKQKLYQKGYDSEDITKVLN